MKITNEQKTKHKIPKTNNGITLIALVITIIVMLILVAVTISMAINGGLFDYAGKAAGETQNAINAEQEIADGKITVDGKVYNSIDDYLAGKVAIFSYEETAKDANGMLTANATYTSGEYTAVIPKGFKIIEGLNGTTTIADGLVIQDVDGNEFVWIPVTYTLANADADNNGYDDGFDSVFYRSNWSNNARGTTKYTATTGSSYNEPLSSGGYANEVIEYNAMVKSVYDNGGFYIGRYEAGSTIARTNKANGTTEMVVKRDAYPYNYVGWGTSMGDYTSEITYSGKNQGLGSLALSKGMYANKDVGVTSTLCYGIQWDAMLDFIKSEKNVTNSITWGNYYDNIYTITRTTAKYTASPSSDTTWNLIDNETEDKKEKTSSESILLTTGASDDFAAKNVFDVAGNIFEWTNEAYSTYARVYRGGRCDEVGEDTSPAAGRKRNSDMGPRPCSSYIGFRTALYIK